MEDTPGHQEGIMIDDEKPSTSKNQYKSKTEVRKADGGGDDSSDPEEDDDRSYSSASTRILETDSSRMIAEPGVTQRGFTRNPGAKMRANQRGQRRKMKGRVRYGKVNKKYKRTVAAAPKRRKQSITRLQKESAISILSTREVPCSEGTCPTCGHRCCLKRCPAKRIRMDEIGFCLRCRRHLLKMASKSYKRQRHRLRLPCRVAEQTIKEEAVQVGSRCFGEVPSLIVKKSKESNAKTVETTTPIEDGCKITPHMIKAAMHKLSKWRQAVEGKDILVYIKNTYPVNQNEEELYAELDAMLEVAVKVGLLEWDEKGRYLLTTKLEKLGELNYNQVTLWEKYRKPNPLKPLSKKIHNVNELPDESSSQAEDYNNMYL